MQASTIASKSPSAARANAGTRVAASRPAAESRRKPRRPWKVQSQLRSVMARYLPLAPAPVRECNSNELASTKWSNLPRSTEMAGFYWPGRDTPMDDEEADRNFRSLRKSWWAHQDSNLGPA